MPDTPILTLIDQARPDSRLPFSDDPNARLLERVAFTHVQDHWSEFVWLTGRISPEALDALYQRLERLRAMNAVAD
jgi:hypothetical protein